MSKLEFTHRRQNPLSGDWVLVSPHRNNRPWLGAVEKENVDALPSYDADCPLCPGNRRAHETVNPEYQGTFVFTNDFGALTAVQENTEIPVADELFQAEIATGECRVVCFSPDHNKSMPELSVGELTKVIDTWVAHLDELAKVYNWVQIFENKGAIMGCSQPHPHGQIWAHDHLPSEIMTEERTQFDYFDKRGKSMLLDYMDRELVNKERVVVENEHWVAVVPYWAAWPFETLLMPKFKVARMNELTQSQRQSLAAALKELTTRYDNVFNCSFPYSMGWHGAPNNQQNSEHWQLHGHFYPPLLRSATVKKHMVGYEMLAESQRDLTAERAAEILRAVSASHYKSECSL